jgi:hypothetical protein
MDVAPFALGCGLGALHVLTGPDHLAAIAPLATFDRSRAWRVGVRWGLGHSGGVLLVALAALWLRDALPLERLSSFSERLVGVVLIGLGAWGFFRLMRSGVAAPRAPHAHTAFAFGTLHGLAGSSHLLGVLPAVAQETSTAALTYLGGFALGTLAAMAAFASSVGWLAARAEARRTHFHRELCGATSAAAIAVGVYWLAAN